MVALEIVRWKIVELFLVISENKEICGGSGCQVKAYKWEFTGINKISHVSFLGGWVFVLDVTREG